MGTYIIKSVTTGFFVHPTSGAHTQHIERAWKTFKQEVYRFRGNLTKQSLRDSLRCIEWNYWLGRKHREGSISIIIGWSPYNV